MRCAKFTTKHEKSQQQFKLGGGDMRLPRGEFSLRSSVQSPFPFETQSLYCFFAGLTSFDVTQSVKCCQSSILYATFIFKSIRRRMKGEKNHLEDRI